MQTGYEFSRFNSNQRMPTMSVSTTKEQIIGILRQSVLYEDYMQRLYDLAAAATETTDISVRAHSAAVDSLFFSQISGEYLNEGKDTTQISAYATMALVGKLLSQSLDTLRSAGDYKELDPVAGLAAQAAEVEKSYDAQRQALITLGDIEPSEQGKVLEQVATEATLVLPRASEIAALASQIEILVTTPTSGVAAN
jgi:hypothetical protein